MQRLCTILICLYFIGVIKAQTPYFHFNEYTPTEIKLNAGVIKGYQDHLGYLWFCGFDGVSRYNGAEFESIESIYPQTSGIEIKHFRSIYVEQDYTVWLCSYGSGLFMVSNSGEMANFDSLVLEGHELLSKVINDVVVVDNQVWVLTRLGLHVYQKNGSSYELSPIDAIPDQSKIQSIISFDNEAIWIRDAKAVYRYNFQNEKLKTFDDFPKSNVSKDKFGNIWILKREKGNYLYQLDKKTDLFVKSKNQPFSSITKAMTIAWDNQNRVWASQFNTQIYMGDMNTGALVMHTSEHHNLKFSQFIRPPLVDNSGGVWFYNKSCYLLPYSCGFDPIHFDVTKEKDIKALFVDDDYFILAVRSEGLLVINQKTGTQKLYTDKVNELANIHISFVQSIGDGKFALGLLNYFQIFDVKKGFIKTIRTKGVVRSFTEDKDFYWIGGLADLLRVSKKDFSKKYYKTTRREGIGRNTIHQLIDKDENHIWVFGSTNGIQLFDKESEVFLKDPILTNTDDKATIFSKIVDADESDNGNYFGVATESGLFVYSKETKELNPFDIAKEYIYATQFQNDSILWSTTSNNLVRCNCITLKCKKYGKQHGLINESFSVRSRYKSPDGKVYFGGDLGLDVAPTYSIKENKFGPSLQVRKMLINRAYQVNINENEIAKIDPGAKIAEIFVDAMHFSHGNSVHVEYKYRDDNVWNLLKFGEQLTLINPRPGKHQIEFRAQNSDGIYNTGNVVIDINFLEVWYKSSWFKWMIGLLLIGMLLLGIWIYNRLKRKQLEKRYELTQEINQLKLQALNAQMNPHFVFNAMSSIQQMIGAKDNKLAMSYLTMFSRLLRHVINYSTDTMVSLDEEIKFIENYLQLEQARFDKLFEYFIEVDNNIELEVVEIPTFFIQPQIENAIKHGLRNSDRKGLLNIKVNQIEDSIVIEIRDNGIGREKSLLINSMTNDNTNKGIELTRKRVDQLNKQGYKTSYTIEDLKDSDGKATGTSVKLKFKIMNS